MNPESFPSDAAGRAHPSRRKGTGALLAITAAVVFALVAGLALLEPWRLASGPTHPTARPADEPALDRPALPPGDAARGSRLFHDPKTMCVLCHLAPGEGGDIGPDLAGVGVRGREYLIDAILRPNKDLAFGFGEVRLTTNSGKPLAGDYVAQDQVGLTYRDADGTAHRVPWADIRHHVFRSPMPSNFSELLSQEALADILAYLEAL